MLNSKMAILFIADPLEKLKIKSDTSLAFAQAAIESGFAVYWCEPTDVMMFGVELVAANVRAVQSISLTNVVAGAREPQPIALSEFRHAFVRKDPPFNEVYRDLCWLLAVQTKTRIHNTAQGLLCYHEKGLQWRAFAEGVVSEDNLVPTCVTGDPLAIESFCNRQRASNPETHFVIKPWMGHGGEDIHLANSVSDVLRYVRSLTIDLHANKLMVQPFLKNIHTDGDRRVLIAQGEVVGSFVRLPAAGHIESNLAQGGRAMLRDMTSRQTALMASLGLFLKRHGIGFAGVDLIGERIGEINITSPTGIRTCEDLTKLPLARKIFESLIKTDTGTSA